MKTPGIKRLISSARRNKPRGAGGPPPLETAPSDSDSDSDADVEMSPYSCSSSSASQHASFSVEEHMLGGFPSEGFWSQAPSPLSHGESTGKAEEGGGPRTVMCGPSSGGAAQPPAVCRASESRPGGMMDVDVKDGEPEAVAESTAVLQRVACRRCKGRGVSGGYKYQCAKCHGAGFVDHVSYGPKPAAPAPSLTPRGEERRAGMPLGSGSGVLAMVGDRVIVITGCDHLGSVGHGAAQDLAKAGYTVIATCLTGAGVASLKGFDGVHAVQVDVTNPEDLKFLLRTFEEMEGANPSARLHAVINNAGVACLGAADWFSLEDYRRTMEVNFMGSVAVTQTLLPHLKASKGRVIFSSSLTGFKACPLNAPYTASKWAIEGFAETLRLELHPFGIQVSIMQLGPMLTPMTANAVDEYKRTFKAAPQDVQEEWGAEFIDPIGKVMEDNKDKLDGPEPAIKGIRKAVSAKAPKPRYRTGVVTAIFFFLHKRLPVKWCDGLYRAAFMAGSVPRCCKVAKGAPGAKGGAAAGAEAQLEAPLLATAK